MRKFRYRRFHINGSRSFKWDNLNSLMISGSRIGIRLNWERLNTLPKISFLWEILISTMCFIYTLEGYISFQRFPLLNGILVRESTMIHLQVNHKFYSWPDKKLVSRLLSENIWEFPQGTSWNGSENYLFIEDHSVLLGSVMTGGQ